MSKKTETRYLLKTGEKDIKKRKVEYFSNITQAENAFEKFMSENLMYVDIFKEKTIETVKTIRSKNREYKKTVTEVETIKLS